MHLVFRREGLARALSLSLGILIAGLAAAQEKSVVPGINKPYEDPNVQQFIGKFEVESREAFAKRKQIVAACQLKPGMAVADVGAGTGLFTRLIAAELGPKGQVYAVDIVPKFLEHVEKTCREAGLTNVKCVLSTPGSIEVPPRSVDLAFLCDVYHHIEFPQKLLASVHGALRPGGWLIVIDFRRIEGKTPEWLMKHVRAGQEVFAREIEAAGFRLLEDVPLLKENYFLRFEKVER